MQRRPRVATNLTYYPNGAIAGFTYGNGIVHTLTQNTRGLPDRSKDADGSTPVHDDSYDYDAVGNVLAISDAVSGNRGNRDMVYDDLNRLESATSPMFGTASYSYDVLDNLTHVQVTAGAQPRRGLRRGQPPDQRQDRRPQRDRPLHAQLCPGALARP